MVVAFHHREFGIVDQCMDVVFYLCQAILRECSESFLQLSCSKRRESLVPVITVSFEAKAPCSSEVFNNSSII